MSYISVSVDTEIDLDDYENEIRAYINEKDDSPTDSPDFWHELLLNYDRFGASAIKEKIQDES
mgnify:CR=1 FL=1